MHLVGGPSRLALLPLAVIAFLIAAERKAVPAWPDVRTVGPFVCHADFSLTAIETLLEDLAELQRDLQQSLGIPSPREPIELYLFQEKASYNAFLARWYPKIPYRRALYLKTDGPGRVFAYRSREFEVDLRHECTHALLHASLPMVPLWLDEGLAEYFEIPRERRAHDNPYLASVRWNARLGLFPSMGGLEKKGSISDMGQGEYRSAWAWVHFMLHGPPEAHDEVVRFLQDIGASTPPGSLSARLQRRLPETHRYFLSHFRTWKRT